MSTENEGKTTVIDHYDYKYLCDNMPDFYDKIKRHGRYHELPEIELKPAVKKELEQIENGTARVPGRDRLVNNPMFRDLEVDRRKTPVLTG